MSYCTLQDVQALNPKRPYNTDSTPAVRQVNALITQIAVEIDNILESQGYTIPITTPANLVNFLKYVNAYGAAYLAEAGMFPETTEPGETAHWQMLKKVFDGYKKDLEEGKIPTSLEEGVLGEDVASYYTEMSDQDDFPDPIFRKRPSDQDF
jgi:hypothetical protein